MEDRDRRNPIMLTLLNFLLHLFYLLYLLYLLTLLTYPLQNGFWAQIVAIIQQQTSGDGQSAMAERRLVRGDLLACCC